MVGDRARAKHSRARDNDAIELKVPVGIAVRDVARHKIGGIRRGLNSEDIEMSLVIFNPVIAPRCVDAAAARRETIVVAHDSVRRARNTPGSAIHAIVADDT